MKKHGPKGTEEDSDWDEDDALHLRSLNLKMPPYRHPRQMHHSSMACTEDPMDNSLEGASLVQMIEASVGTESQDVVQIHVGDDDLE